MTFEGLLPFILLFIMWGASRILLKMGKTNQKKQAPADQKPGFLKMLQEHLANLEEKDKDAESNDLDEYFQTISQLEIDEDEEEFLTNMEEVSQQQEPPITGKETVPISPPNVVIKPRAAILRKKPLAMMNRRKLQNAVIWAEILAPPVALRDQ
jgi:hypothetical protein